MSRSKALLAGVAIWVLSSPGARADEEYRVRFREGDPPRIEVIARLELRDGFLQMARGGGIDHLKDQWATFIRSLRVSDGDGRDLEIEPRGPVGFSLPGARDGPVTVSYDVDLGFTMKPWPPGNEQAGLWQDESLYLVTKPLFVYSRSGGAKRIRFDLPTGFHVSAPWDPAASEANTFVARDIEDLVDNSIVIGKHEEKVFRQGNFTFVLALVGPIRESEPIVARTLEAVAEHAVSVFPRTPESRYMMTLFYAKQDDGEAFARSAAFTTAAPPTKDGVPLWGNDLAHELYHLWIGGAIHGPDDGGTEWFDEGFTDYYADRALVQTGLTSESMFLRKAEKVLARYLYSRVSPLFPRGLTPAEASADKGRFRFAVYDGGWSAAFCLDTRIRHSTSGRRSLDDVMRALHQRFGLEGKSFSLDSLESITEQVGGAPARDLLRSYLGGVELPLDRCLHEAGLEGHFQPYACELWITKRPDATDADRLVLQGITSKQAR